MSLASGTAGLEEPTYSQSGTCALDFSIFQQLKKSHREGITSRGSLVLPLGGHQCDLLSSNPSRPLISATSNDDSNNLLHCLLGNEDALSGISLSQLLAACNPDNIGAAATPPTAITSTTTAEQQQLPTQKSLAVAIPATASQRSLPSSPFKSVQTTLQLPGYLGLYSLLNDRFRL
ncbi:hypothetical protein EV182_005842, partial [Spiromyces aspiralis]